jgi:hypothetical protein
MIPLHGTKQLSNSISASCIRPPPCNDIVRIVELGSGGGLALTNHIYIILYPDFQVEEAHAHGMSHSRANSASTFTADTKGRSVGATTKCYLSQM